MRKFLKRHFGQILIDAGFVSRGVLDSALQEQRSSRERLGEILVRMGAVQRGDVEASLLLQNYLLNMEDAATLAVGERQMLGSLLVESGRISQQDLDRAIAEQERSGGKLGEVLVRLGFLSQEQLKTLLSFQANQQAHTSSPFRLGELLVTTGDLSRQQLDAALAKKNGSTKKLGEVLVEEGYVHPGRIDHCVSLQKMLMHAALAAIFSIGIAATAHAASVELQWDPSPDANVAGYKIHYQADSQVQPFQGTGSAEGAAPIDVRTQLTATVNGLDPGHTYYFAVTAYDDSGNESMYSNVVSAEAPYPAPSITYPLDGTSVNGTVTVLADSMNNPSVTGMQFYVDGALKGSDTSGPYQFQWDSSTLSPGSHTLQVKTVDAKGAVVDSGTVTVQVTSKDSTPPTVALTAPQGGTVVSGTTIIAATAADDIGVSRVEFYKDGALLFAGNTAPFTFSWDTSSVANGAHTLVAKAYDAAGHVTQTGEISVLVNNVVADTVAPVVRSFSLPVSAASLTVPVSSLSASDDAAVTGYMVTESAGAPAANASGWSATPPSSFTFSGSGARTAYAWAKDAAGNVSAAASGSVTITLPDPTATTLTVADALMALNIAAGKVAPTPEQISRLDVGPVVDGKYAPDGVVNTGDVVVILSKLTGKS